MDEDLLKKLEASLQAQFPVRRHVCVTAETQKEISGKESYKPAYRGILRTLKKRPQTAQDAPEAKNP